MCGCYQITFQVNSRKGIFAASQWGEPEVTRSPELLTLTSFWSVPVACTLLLDLRTWSVLFLLIRVHGLTLLLCHAVLSLWIPFLSVPIHEILANRRVSTGNSDRFYFLGRWNKNQRSHSVQFSSVAQSCPTLCDPMNWNTPGLLVHHQLPEFTQTHVHWVGDAIQPSHPLSSPSPPAPNPS